MEFQMNAIPSNPWRSDNFEQVGPTRPYRMEVSFAPDDEDGLSFLKELQAHQMGSLMPTMAVTTPQKFRASRFITIENFYAILSVQQRASFNGSVLCIVEMLLVDPPKFVDISVNLSSGIPNQLCSPTKTST